MLVYDICHRLKISRDMVVGHGQINSVQRADPKNFDWDRFNRKVDDVSRMMAIRFGPDYAVNS
jgi:N-acetyl-anhydromuramyl-L-alanine amidase AmpD